MDFEKIINNIEIIRAERGMTKSELVKRVRKIMRDVGREEARKAMSLRYLGACAEALGCTVGELTDGFEDASKYHVNTDITGFYPYNLAAAVLIMGYNSTFKPQSELELQQCIERVQGVYLPALTESLESLTDREKNVIERRFRDGWTLEQTGKEFGVTAERIREIEARAIRKLRHPRHAKHWMFDTAGKAEEAMKERDALKLECINLRAKLIRLYDERGMAKEKEWVNKARRFDLPEDATVDDLELSVRSYNCLKRVGINMASEMAGWTMEDFSKVRNLGRKSVIEIITKLKERGFIIPATEETT